MPRQKLNRYERINNDSRVIKGLQNQHILFPNAGKIVLELACGRGEYSIGLAPTNPDALFVGIDSKGERIGVGLDKVHQAGLENVRFIWGIIHHVDRWFSPESIDEIWIIHPDPRPRIRDTKRRLTHPRFLNIYKKLLKKGGLLKLKTDNKELFDYSVEQFEHEGWTQISLTNDVYNSELLSQHHGIQTHYEKLALDEGRKINYGVRCKSE